MLFGVGDNCSRWGCIRTGGGMTGRRQRKSRGDDDDDDNDGNDRGRAKNGDEISLETYDVGVERDGAGTTCCPGSQCVPTRRHRRRRKSSSRDKSPGKESPSPRRSRCAEWPRCLSILLFIGGCRRSGCCCART